jgi:hypothetical protein
MDDDEIEYYSEKVRAYEGHHITAELSKLYHNLRALNEDDKITSEEDESKEKVSKELAILKRRIGVLEQEMGRRKKAGSWVW